MTALSIGVSYPTLAQWREWIDRRYKSKGYRTRILRYVENLQSRNLPVIFGIRSIEQYTGVRAEMLSSMIRKPDDFYRVFNIPKRRGGVRTIRAPYPLLLKVQRWVNSAILAQVSVHENAHGYVHDKSILSHARKHAENQYLLLVDLKDFFPSVKHYSVISQFEMLGYSKRVSRILAGISCHDGVLPQGGATSPTLSNLVLFPLDNALTEFSSYYGITYSRYADDLAFSWNGVAEHPFETIESIVDDHGFAINPTKVHRAGPTERKFITGLSISSGQVRIPRATKRALRQECHYLLNKELSQLLIRPEFTDLLYIERLKGRMQFWHHIEPENQFATEALMRLRNLNY